MYKFYHDELPIYFDNYRPVIIYKLYISKHYDILYQNLVTMYIGNLCDSGRFHSMGFLEKLCIKIF